MNYYTRRPLKCKLTADSRGFDPRVRQHFSWRLVMESFLRSLFPIINLRERDREKEEKWLLLGAKLNGYPWKSKNFGCNKGGKVIHSHNSQFFFINPILVQPIFAKQPQPLPPPPRKKNITLNTNLKVLVWTADIRTDISHPYDIDFGVMSDLYFMVQWFCLISWRLFDGLMSYLRILIIKMTMTQRLTS